ncbi:MAG: hypothetical protein E6I75_25500 [Chloroflexi bacterium]|nr:MAG: hypothetical protein E6I75_25500 [Chloroflexota bacterium]
MRPFQLHQPEGLDEALSLLEQYGTDDAHLIAGGTSLMLLMNLGLIEPSRVISLRRVSALRGVAAKNGGAGLEMRCAPIAVRWLKRSGTLPRCASAIRGRSVAIWHTPTRRKIRRQCSSRSVPRSRLPVGRASGGCRSTNSSSIT